MYYQCKAAHNHSSLEDENSEESGTPTLLSVFIIFQNTSNCSALILQVQWEHPHSRIQHLFGIIPKAKMKDNLENNIQSDGGSPSISKPTMNRRHYHLRG